MLSWQMEALHVLLIKNGVSNLKKQTFESAIEKLQEIVDKLESSDESLDDSLKLFEEGSKLASFCYSTLKKAEQKVVKLSENDVNFSEEN